MLDARQEIEAVIVTDRERVDLDAGAECDGHGPSCDRVCDGVRGAEHAHAGSDQVAALQVAGKQAPGGHEPIRVRR